MHVRPDVVVVEDQVVAQDVELLSHRKCHEGGVDDDVTVLHVRITLPL